MNFTLVIKNSSDNFHLVDFRSFLLVYESLDLDLKISFLYIKHWVENYFKSFTQYCFDSAMYGDGC